MRDLIVIGGGGHARVVIETARATRDLWRVIGFVDPSSCAETQSHLNIPRLGSDDALAHYPNAAFILGIGAVGVSDRRQQVVVQIDAAESRWATLIHPGACVSASAIVGAGTVVLAGAIVASRARLGAHCIINHNAVVDHDATLGAFVHASPGSIIAGGAAVGEGSYIGMGALIRDHITLGHSCLVGMGAVVTKSFNAGSVLAGVPAARDSSRPL
jgi:acetyltransferase EpsM